MSIPFTGNPIHNSEFQETQLHHKDTEIARLHEVIRELEASNHEMKAKNSELERMNSSDLQKELGKGKDEKRIDKELRE